MKITHLEDSYGEILTVLPAEHKRRQLTQLGAADLAQLIIDLRTIPQPQLRPMEVDNLAALLASYARAQYGPVFISTLAQQFMSALSQVRPFDDKCCQAEAKLVPECRLTEQRVG